MTELFDQLLYCAMCVSGGPGVIVFVKERKRVRFPPGNRQRSIAKHSFSVDDVAEDLANVPLVLGVPKIGLLFGQDTQGLTDSLLLALQAGQNIVLRNQ